MPASATDTCLWRDAPFGSQHFSASSKSLKGFNTHWRLWPSKVGGRQWGELTTGGRGRVHHWAESSGLFLATVSILGNLTFALSKKVIICVWTSLFLIYTNCTPLRPIQLLINSMSWALLVFFNFHFHHVTVLPILPHLNTPHFSVWAKPCNSYHSNTCSNHEQ